MSGDLTESRIQTYSGEYFNFTAPDATKISIFDIARALSHTCRFAGHVNTYYSVAEHSVLVAHILREWGCPDVRGGFLHDAAEAFLGDITRPYKKRLGDRYKEDTKHADDAIAEYLGLNAKCFHTGLVERADNCALKYEGERLKKHWDHEGDELPEGALTWKLGLLPLDAERLFLKEAVKLGLGVKVDYAPPLPRMNSTTQPDLGKTIIGEPPRPGEQISFLPLTKGATNGLETM